MRIHSYHIIFLNLIANTSANSLELASALECSTDWPFLTLSHIYKYGCFCGKGNTNEDLDKLSPVDKIDQCCYNHDDCYKILEDRCLTSLENYYEIGYKWKCQRLGNITNPSGTSVCLPSKHHSQIKTECAEIKCKCDMNLANCLSHTGEKPNSIYYKFDKNECPKQYQATTSIITTTANITASSPTNNPTSDFIIAIKIILATCFVALFLSFYRKYAWILRRNYTNFENEYVEMDL